MLESIATWDAEVLLFIQEHLRTQIGNVFFVLWTTLGNRGILWICAAVLMLFFARTRRAGILSLAGLAINFVVVNLIVKPWVARLRPWLVVKGLEPLIQVHDSNSFPSGHTSAAFAFAAVMCACLDVQWAKYITVVAAILMGWSRLYVGVHFPTDVIAGAILGVLCGLMAVWMYRKFFANKFSLK